MNKMTAQRILSLRLSQENRLMLFDLYISQVSGVPWLESQDRSRNIPDILWPLITIRGKQKELIVGLFRHKSLQTKIPEDFWPSEESIVRAKDTLVKRNVRDYPTDDDIKKLVAEFVLYWKNMNARRGSWEIVFRKFLNSKAFPYAARKAIWDNKKENKIPGKEAEYYNG